MYMKFYIIIFLIALLSLSCGLFPVGPAGEGGLDGSDGLPGSDGTDGIALPGGTISVYDDSNTILAESSVKIIFDDDVIINEGDPGEYQFTINIGAYRNGTSINHSQSWSAPGVPPGAYYVYAWLDLDNNGTFETGTTYHFIFDMSSDYIYNTGNIISNNDPASIAPNYTIWDNFAAQINISFSHSV